MKAESIISIRNLGHNFGENKVLDGINLEVKRGEIIGLLGPSGAGKTTMVNILTGQIKPATGEAMVLGESSLSLSSEAHSKIGIMMESFGFYERLSVADNLKIYAGIFRAPAERIDEVLKRTGMYEAKKTPVMKLSKGMKGRVNLCRAFLKDAELLFLDEPTSGLDPSIAKEIHDILLDEKARGTTIFLTTHNMYEATLLCDNVALLNNGEIVEYGNPGEVCRKYNHLNRIQIQLTGGELIELPNDKTAAARVAELFEQEKIVTIHSTEPTLESVFLELTGRRFESI